jgi:dCTP deaminase
MILPDHAIQKLCVEAGMVTPFDLELVNPASLDVRLGDNVLIELEEQKELHPLSITRYSKEKPFLLMPDEFILAQTLETFNMPSNVCGQFALKSSLARAGFEHLLAGWIDPGFHGSVLTLELKNARRLHELPLWPGMRIGQIIFSQTTSMPLKTYAETGRYNKDATVKGCKGLT